MKVTEALRKYLSEKHGIKADATRDEVMELARKLIVSKELSPEKLAELAPQVKRKVDAKSLIATAVADAMAPMMKSFAETMSKLVPQAAGVGTGNSTPPVTGDKSSPDALMKDHANAVAKADADSNTDIRVKSVKEKYDLSRKSAMFPSHTKAGTPHPMAGQQVIVGGKSMEHQSQFDKALNRAYFKWVLRQQLSREGLNIPGLKMTPHDEELMAYALNEGQWVGDIRGDGLDPEGVKLSERQRKDILDDAGSGGTYAVPIYFDDMMVLTPVLMGELLPLVEIVNMARGKTVDGSSMTNPTWTSGTSEGTSITPFSTAGFIANMDSTIYPVVSAVAIGQDFEQDTPIAFADNMMAKMGETLQAWLDDQIIGGDGTTEPQGILNASGTTAYAAVNNGGAITVGDLEGLYFSMNKAYRNALGKKTCFISTDQTYNRVRGIPVGPNDARRIYGMTHDDYSVMQRPYKVNNNITNAYIVFANLGGYRLYRRLGFTLRVETAGQTLALKNEKLIVARARFGGKLTLGGYASIISNTQV